MKNLLTLLLILTINDSFGQWPNNAAIISKAGVKGRTITAIEYENGKEVDKHIYKETFDNLGYSSSFITIDAKGNETNKSITESLNRGTLRIKKEYNENGMIVYSFYWLHDTLKHRMDYFQLSSQSDTLVSQRRFFDKNGYDSILYTKVNNNKWQITNTFKYDEFGNLVYKGDQKGNKVIYSRDSMHSCVEQYSETKPKLLKRKTCIDKKSKIDYFYQNSEGYLYGIKLKERVGGKRIENFLDNGVTNEIIYINEYNDVLAKIDFIY